MSYFEIPDTTNLDPTWTLYDLLVERVSRTPNSVVVQFKDSDTGKFTGFTGLELLSYTHQIARGLINLGIKPGDSVAITSHTSIQWTLLDLAIQTVGGVTVPIYETSSAAQISYIVKDANVKLVFAENLELASRCEKAENADGKCAQVFAISEGAVQNLIDLGRDVEESEIAKIQQTRNGDDVCSIVYTSGSTGKPKGVVIQNKAMLSVSYDTTNTLPEIVDNDACNLLLFLPLAHGFARFCQYAIISSKGKLTLSGSIATLIEDLSIVKPTVLLGVPRIFEKVYNAASHKASSGMSKLIFEQAARTAVEYSKELERVGGKKFVRSNLRAKRAMYNTLVYSKIMSVMGGHVGYAVCGGAPMNSEIAHFFQGAGLLILEGYGMTETCAPCLVNRPTYNKMGTIGVPFPGVNVGIAEDGELLLNTSYAFSGYNNNESATAETLFPYEDQSIKVVQRTQLKENGNDKWLATGDLGSIDEDGFVRIIGRKKELIVTAGGKNVSPTPLETIMDSEPVIGNSVVIGDLKPFIAALITLDPDELNNWCDRQGRPHFANLTEASQDSAIRSQVQTAVDRANELVSRAESIRKFKILNDEFTEASGTLTPSMKIRRKQILDKYSDVVKSIYQK
jgi:long-chain acyl-CoA synthetase